MPHENLSWNHQRLYTWPVFEMNSASRRHPEAKYMQLVHTYHACLPCDSVVKVSSERGYFNAGASVREIQGVFLSAQDWDEFSRILFLAGIEYIGVPRAESLVIKYFTFRAYLSTYLPTILILHPLWHFQSFTQDEDNTGKTWTIIDSEASSNNKRR